MGACVKLWEHVTGLEFVLEVVYDGRLTARIDVIHTRGGEYSTQR